MTQKIDTKNNLSPRRRLKLSLLSGFLFVFIIGVMVVSSQSKKDQVVQTTQEISKYSQTIPEKDYFAYQGKAGKDALTILRDLTGVEQDRSGLVVSINGRKADNTKKEYWSFFINGKMAQVGPADFQTTDKDFIEWKIQTY